MKKIDILKERKDIDKKYLWKIEDLFETDLLWEEEFKSAASALEKLEEYAGRVSADNLFTLLQLKDSLAQRVEKLFVYASLRTNEDSTVAVYQALNDRGNQLLTSFNEKTAFIEPEIIALGEGILEKCEGSVLEVYKHYLSELFRNQQHILSPEKETLLAAFGDVASAPSTIYSRLNNADLKFNDITDKDGVAHSLTHGNFISFMQHSDRVLRKNAFNSFYDSYKALANTIGATYNSSVKTDWLYSSLRGFSSTLEGSLFADNIPTGVYHSLIDTVNENIGVMHKYVALRKKALGLSDLNIYDIYATLVEDFDTSISFDEAFETVLEALKPLGEEYISVLRDSYSQGWIDIYENKGKRSGAYAWGVYGSHPFVSLNFNDTIDAMFTLAHEMGHAMHSYYTWGNQPYIYGDYTIFVAEVASTVNEALLMNYLLRTTTDINKKKYLINYFMEQFRGTLFRQTMFAEFELIAHEMVESGEPLTFESLSEKYMALNRKYFGEDIELDEKISWEWCRIPHFYTAYYVYQYATGYSCAIALSKLIEEGKSENYLKFLKGGSCDYSIELLKLAGVDISTPAPVKAAIKVFEGLIDQMDTLLNKQEG